eukprot:14838521-Alexandrium_andersonii.AAC.1
MPWLQQLPTLAPRSPRQPGRATGAPRLREPPRLAPGMAPAPRSRPGPPPSQPRKAGRLAAPHAGAPSWLPARRTPP